MVTALVNWASGLERRLYCGEGFAGSVVSFLRSPRLMILIIAFALNNVIGSLC